MGTLWQACIAVDPTVPRSGKVTDQEGNTVENWQSIPSQKTIIKALLNAAGLNSMPKKPTLDEPFSQEDKDGMLKSMGITGAKKQKCPECGSTEYSLMPTDFETAKCDKCGKNWNHGIVKGVNDPSDSKTAAGGMTEKEEAEHHRQWMQKLKDEHAMNVRRDDHLEVKTCAGCGEQFYANRNNGDYCCYEHSDGHWHGAPEGAGAERVASKAAAHHHERVECRKCGNIRTCRCSAKKTATFVDECPSCPKTAAIATPDLPVRYSEDVEPGDNLPEVDEIHYVYYGPSPGDEGDNDYYTVVGFKDGEGLFNVNVPAGRLKEVVGDVLAEKMVLGEGQIVRGKDLPGGYRLEGVENPFKSLVVHNKEFSQMDTDWLAGMHITACIAEEFCPQCNKDAEGCKCPNKADLLDGKTRGDHMKASVASIYFKAIQGMKKVKDE